MASLILHLSLKQSACSGKAQIAENCHPNASGESGGFSAKQNSDILSRMISLTRHESALTKMLLGLSIFFISAACLPGNRLASCSASDDIYLFKSVRFCHDLLSNQEYYRAITEFMRVSSFFPEEQVQEFSFFGCGLADYLAAEDEDSLRFFRSYLRSFPRGKYISEADCLISAGLARKGDLETAVRYFENLDRQFFDLSQQENTGYILSYYQTIKSLQNQGISPEIQSSFSFESLSRSNSEVGRKSEEALEWLKSLKLSGSRKSPVLAGLLAVVPGAGHLYVGDRNAALSSFIFNSIFLYATVKAIQEHQEQYAILFGAFESGFYFGNIFSAVNSANKHNQRLIELKIKQFQFLFEPVISYHRDPEDIFAFGITCSFGKTGHDSTDSK
jgi:hypothetical protein